MESEQHNEDPIGKNFTLESVEQFIGNVRDQLRDGGPQVDHEDLQAFLDGSSGELVKKEVARLIVMYRPWYEAYCNKMKAGE